MLSRCCLSSPRSGSSLPRGGESRYNGSERRGSAPTERRLSRALQLWSPRLMGSTEEQLIHARVIPEANPARTIMDDWHPRLFVPHELLLA
jgi:hypothetical protein